MSTVNEDIKHRSEEVFGQTPKGAASIDEKSKVREGAESIAEKSKEETKQRVVPFLSDRKERLVEQLNQTADALRETEKQIDNDRGMDLIRMSAQKIEQLGGYLGNRDINEIIDDLRKYARARPWTFAGGAFVLGLATARFIKAGGRSTPTRS